MKVEALLQITWNFDATKRRHFPWRAIMRHYELFAQQQTALESRLRRDVHQQGKLREVVKRLQQFLLPIRHSPVSSFWWCFIEKPACDEIERECDEVFVKASITCRSRRWRRETFILGLRSDTIFSLIARSTGSLSSPSEGAEMEIKWQVMEVSKKTWMGRRASSLFGLLNADSFVKF